ncbi:hypothetical protein V1283_007701 [Bradyrhizobium sp. AZCC 2262]|uniref:hypothetical protein n=1 Tax=Bradyrhizobium sp. AZCC 2262 TaxID=3117022 RepID=UPI002FF257DF
MADPDIDQLLQNALIGSRPAILAYLKAVADPRIVAKFELVNFNLLQQVEALAHKERLRDSGMPMEEIIEVTTRVFGLNTRSLLRGGGSGYDTARAIHAEMVKARAKAELMPPPIQGDFPPV